MQRWSSSAYVTLQIGLNFAISRVVVPLNTITRLCNGSNPLPTCERARARGITRGQRFSCARNCGLCCTMTDNSALELVCPFVGWLSLSVDPRPPAPNISLVTTLASTVRSKLGRLLGVCPSHLGERHLLGLPQPEILHEIGASHPCNCPNQGLQPTRA